MSNPFELDKFHASSFHLSDISLMSTVSYMASGTFHVFDVAEQLYAKGVLESVCLSADLPRVLKWKKGVPLSRVKYSKWPPVKFGRLRRPGDEEKLARLIAEDHSQSVVGFPSFSRRVFELVGDSKLKVLDIDNFSWDLETTELLSGCGFKHLDTKRPVDPSAVTMLKSEMEQESKLRGFSFEMGREKLLKAAQEIDAADMLIVPVSYVRDALIGAGYPAEKIRLIRYGYDSRIFFPKTGSKASTKVLYAGTISYRKGWPHLREILRGLSGTDVQVSIVGNIESLIKSEVIEFLEQCDPNIHYLGPKSQSVLAEHMRNSRVSIFPSVLEGFGMTIIQALACGTPVITTKATCGVDLIRNGENGYVLEKSDTGRWLERIREICLHQDTARRMGENAASAVRELTWSDYASELLSALSERGAYG